MSIYETLMNRRTVRKFKQTPIDKQALQKLIDVARMAPTGANRQPLLFGIISDSSLCSLIFPHTKWAGYLREAYGSPADAPTAYIAVFAKEEDAAGAELASGSAIENMLLLAHDLGLGSCWLGAIDRAEILEILGITGYKLLYLVAFGIPAEAPIAVAYEGDVKYYLDDTNTLNVPKKSIEQVLILNR